MTKTIALHTLSISQLEELTTECSQKAAQLGHWLCDQAGTLHTHKLDQAGQLLDLFEDLDRQIEAELLTRQEVA
jgi:hypothetical protein